MQFRNGDNVAALETYRNAFAEMNQLCEEQPSLSALRIWRARGYTSAAQAATGAGEVAAAILLREQAAVELMELLEAQPNRADVQVELSAALSAIAESALEEGELDRAGDLAARSLELLETAVANPEERAGALNQLASLQSVLAACRAGTGQPKEALRLVREGQSHAEAALLRDRRSGAHFLVCGAPSSSSSSYSGFSYLCSEIIFYFFSRSEQEGSTSMDRTEKLLGS